MSNADEQENARKRFWQTDLAEIERQSGIDDILSLSVRYSHSLVPLRNAVWLPIRRPERGAE